MLHSLRFWGLVTGGIAFSLFFMLRLVKSNYKIFVNEPIIE